jgi:3',5'-cyclic AMP phosphodiesterase CpdA
MTRIAHITDLHLLALGGVGFWRFANKRITGYANLRFRRKAVHRAEIVQAVVSAIDADPPDHLIVTGDLTNLSLETVFELALKVLGQLRMGPERISVVPGNHDVYTLGSHRARRFEGYFKPYVSSDLPLPDGSVFPFVRLGEDVAVIGLSSALPRPPLVASGRLGRWQTDALDRLALDPRIRARFPVVLVHHPLINPPSPWKTRFEGLADAASLEAIMRRLGRGLVAHGHLHRRMHRRLGPIHVVGATSTSLESAAPDRMSGYNVYEIERGELVRASARVLDLASGTFREVAVPEVEVRAA